MPELGDINALLQRYYYSGDQEEYYMQPIADGRGGLIVLAGYNGLYVIQDKESFLRAYSHAVVFMTYRSLQKELTKTIL